MSLDPSRLASGQVSPSPVDRLGRWEPARWSLTLYPGAGEAGGSFVSGRARAVGTGVRGAAEDPERARAEAARRARAVLRRYCAGNRLNRLGTLTYAGQGCHDAAVLKADVARFFRRLRSSLGAPFPYVWVAEWHPGGHGLHVHFTVGRFINRSLIEAAWGHGFVHIKMLGDLPVGSGTWAEARLAARYLGKYVSKTFDPDSRRVLGAHRYERAQGFKPAVMRLQDRSRDGVIEQACRVMGQQPRHVWFSDDVEGWDGPPAYWVAW